MTKIETGHATLKTNEEGKKYWSIWGQDSKGTTSFKPGQMVSFNPDAFDCGAIIKVFEDVK